MASERSRGGGSVACWRQGKGMGGQWWLPGAVCRWTLSSRAAALISTGHPAFRSARRVMFPSRSRHRCSCRSRREQAAFLQLDKHASSVAADEPSVRVSVMPAAPPDPVLKGKMDDIEELRAKAEKSMFEQARFSVL